MCHERDDVSSESPCVNTDFLSEAVPTKQLVAVAEQQPLSSGALRLRRESRASGVCVLTCEGEEKDEPTVHW